jgi:hypothetical protein
MIARDGQVKLLDFGLATAFDDTPEVAGVAPAGTTRSRSRL